jgi:hypothetical protein
VGHPDQFIVLSWFSPFSSIIKVKKAVLPIKDHEGSDGKLKYSSTLSLTSALNGVGGQCHAPVALPQENIHHASYRRLGRPGDRSGQVWNI